MLEQLLQQAGYPAVVLGTFLEGEMSILLASFLAFRGYLQIEWVVACVFVGTFASDQLWYFLGRRHGRRILARRPSWRALGDKAQALLALHPDLWVLCFRFFWGMRTVMPIVIGLSGYSWRRYLVLDGIGAIIWAVALGAIGYNLGYALTAVIEDFHLYQMYLLGALVLLGLLVWLYRRRRDSGE
ncbi:DedA family protein [Pseudomonas matsuisoli]|nr:DedA family protein [Pseudomonas matsuisoli]